MTMREFFVLRRYRRHGLGEDGPRLIWKEHPGAWGGGGAPQRMRRRCLSGGVRSRLRARLKSNNVWCMGARGDSFDLFRAA